MALTRPEPPPISGRASTGCCRSSVVEHSLGKGEVDSSILSGSTIQPPDTQSFSCSHAPLSPADAGGTEHELENKSGENPGTPFREFTGCSPAADRDPLRWVYDGRTLLGHVYMAGKKFEADMASGRLLGLFPSAIRAAEAIRQNAASAP